MQPIVSESWPHPKLDAHIKPQPTNEKCWRQADRRIKSNQPIRESKVFRAQTARQLDLTIRRPLRENPVRLRQTPPDSVRLRRASQSCDCDERCNFVGLCSRDAGLTHHQTSLDETGHRWTCAEIDATECECYTANLSLSLSG